FQTLVRILTGVKASDTQSGLKAGRASSLKRIFPLLSVKQYAFDVEMLAVAQLMGMKTVELPIRLKQTSRFSTKLVIRMMIDLLGISYRLHIKRWYQSNLNSSDPNYYPLLKW